jgi:hypothetical protein
MSLMYISLLLHSVEQSAFFLFLPCPPTSDILPLFCCTPTSDISNRIDLIHYRRHNGEYCSISEREAPDIYLVNPIRLCVALLL